MTLHAIKMEANSVVAELQKCFDNQRQAYLAEPTVSYEQRVKDLKTLARMMQDHQDAIVQAISDDFGNRSSQETLFCEFYVVLEGIKDTIKHLKKWMKPQRRHTPLTAYPTSKSRVIPQPLGLVGIIVPWNFPCNLTFAPLTSIFAAGNRAMVKMSANSNRLAMLLKRVSADYFPEEKLAFFEGAGGTGSAFSKLPFDHLIFTGSTDTGKAVMAAAAPNLTPVTLELGGKSPAVVAPDFPIEKAAERIMFWKLLNAGQICTTIDYLFLPEDKVDAFVAEARKLVKQRYPNLATKDYTSIIDLPSFQRLKETLEDAEAKGARLINLNAGPVPDEQQRKFAPHLVLNVNEDMDVMQREIFGPILPIMTYKDPQEVVEYVTQRDRPLALYPFTNDQKLQAYYIDRIMSGGVSVNNALLHVAQHDMPFGGVGASGMGHYHGYEGFITFSKLRPVFYQGAVDPIRMLMPPYTDKTRKIMNFMMKMVRF